ncbi:MAG TPA: hypothetical protein PLU69_10630 [Acinetobacter sp.]|jgi:hypothetical protein|nr:hypothetical protein [Acinetobacter sp.]
MQFLERYQAKNEVDLGWWSLIDRLLVALPENVRIKAIKQKWGVLRITLDNNADEKLLDLVRELETESSTICEFCGKTGEIRGATGLRFVRCLCDEHFAERQHLYVLPKPINPVKRKEKNNE